MLILKDSVEIGERKEVGWRGEPGQTMWFLLCALGSVPELV